MWQLRTASPSLRISPPVCVLPLPLSWFLASKSENPGIKNYLQPSDCQSDTIGPTLKGVSGVSIRCPVSSSYRCLHSPPAKGAHWHVSDQVRVPSLKNHVFQGHNLSSDVRAGRLFPSTYHSHNWLFNPEPRGHPSLLWTAIRPATPSSSFQEQVFQFTLQWASPRPKRKVAGWLLESPQPPSQCSPQIICVH